MTRNRFPLIILFPFVLLVLILILSPLDFCLAQDEPAETGDSYKVVLYANNTLFMMNPDGSNRLKVLEQANILEFIPLSDGRIFIHSKQYEGNSLEIFEPETGVRALVEFSEGIFPNISVSDDGSTVAYEVKHLPISTSGDGVWLFEAEEGKSHVKITGSALSIEAISLYKKRLHMLYHELDLISDEAGLFIESFPINKSSKSKKNKIPEGMKTFLAGGYTLGFTYPTSGRRLALGHLHTGRTVDIAVPGGDIALDSRAFYLSDKPMLVMNAYSFDFEGEEKSETYLWKTSSSKLEPFTFENMVDIGNYRWSPDGFLYFTARYEDLSGEKSELMLFRKDIKSEETRLVSVLGGPVAFSFQ